MKNSDSFIFPESDCVTDNSSPNGFVGKQIIEALYEYIKVVNKTRFSNYFLIDEFET